MTHVARVELTNWMRFRSAAFDLGPRAYAVEAEDEADPARSNWLCKTGNIEAFPFALYGWHRFQEGERASGYEDEWISHWADEGGAKLHLSDGSRIERTRERGRSTQLVLRRPGLPDAFNERAQEAINAMIGLSRDDFFSTAFVRQKLCAQLVSARPADRMGLIADWLDFAKLEVASRHVSARISAKMAERERLVGRVAEVGARIRSLEAEEHFGLRLADGAEEAMRKGELVVGERAAILASVEASFAPRARWEADEKARQIARISEMELQDVEARLAATPEVDIPDASEAVGRRRLAIASLDQARRLARGEFDGACPVRRGFSCPAKTDLNAGTAESAAAVRRAQEEAAAAGQSAARAEAAAEEARLNRRERDRLEERASILRLQASAAATSSPRTPPPAVSRADLDAARAAHQGAVAALAVLTRAALDLSRLREEHAKASADLAAIERTLTECRAARLVLGRGGAQRRIAEAAVGAIARGANERLASRRIDLRISLSWRREGAELASSCDGCGAAFPKSRTARTCAGCGGARGKAVQDRLDVELSDRSGAAEDLAGLALQRSACAFLRRRRSAPWATLVLDEPFGALDERHREAVARSLAGTAAEDGLEQLLVVAHQPGILESLPGRILIRGRGAESTVEVIE